MALKVQSPDLMHKSDAGALALGLAADEDVRRAFKQVLSAVASRAPGAAIDGVLVQEMVSEGVEILVGMKRDPVFGPAIVVSPGGVFVELFEGASQVRLAPLGIEEAEAMVKRSRRASRSCWPDFAAVRQPTDRRLSISLSISPVSSKDWTTASWLSTSIQ